jgi:flagellar biosynthesis protein FliR
MAWDFDNFLLVFVRASGFLSILPIFTMLNIPMQVRVAFGALMAVLVAPTLPPSDFSQLPFMDWVGLYAQEGACGLAIGFVTRMVFFVADFAGQVISHELGLNLASVFDPVNSQPTQVPSLLMFLLTCMLMVTLDMHHWLLTGFQYTYSLAPIGQTRLSEAVFVEVLNHTSRVFLVGVQIAGPLIAASFLTLVLLGFLGRLVPQMNVFAESFSMRLACGLAALAFTFDISAQHLLNCLRRLPEDMLRVAQLLQGG